MADSLKRRHKDNYELCLICQDSKPDVLEDKQAQSIATLKERAFSRKRLGDVSNIEVIGRIESIREGDEIKCHRTCYSNFTHKKSIQMLQSKLTRDIESQATHLSTPQKQPASTSFTSRRSVIPMQWNLCIFCQDGHVSDKLFNITTFQVSNKVLEDAKLDHIMRLRLAGVSDLIAAEGKYHNKCMVLFKYNSNKTKSECCNTGLDLPMILLLRELEHAATKPHIILPLSNIWDRYCLLVEEASLTIPLSYTSRRSSFKEALAAKLSNLYQFVCPLNRHNEERETLLVPHRYAQDIISNTHYDNNYEYTDLNIQRYEHEDESFLTLVHTALKIRNDLQKTDGYVGLDISEEASLDCIPDSLYMFLNILYGGQDVLENESSSNENKSNRQTKLLSVAQDIVYGVSNEKKWTPKHVGLATTLHQMTRSKHLVNLFHAAGHTLSYKDTMRVDTSLAEKSIESMDKETGNFLPPNLKTNVFTHFTADNIDISDSTHDGKNTFHATQVAAWQRGNGDDLKLGDIRVSNKETLTVPENMDNIIPANISEGKTIPLFSNPVDVNIFTSCDNDIQSARHAQALDMSFHILRSGQECTKTWSAFNQDISNSNPEMTTVGYMPIIQAPAHGIDTLNTVVQRCLHISESLGQLYTVITVDQALYFKLMDLKWAIPAYREALIPRLGGLHISMNFLKTIGDHMKGCGLHELWVESELLGPIASEQVLLGKHYNRGMRAHKITYQAIWQLLLPQFKRFLEASDTDTYNQLIELKSQNNLAGLVTLFQDDKFRKLLLKFAENRSPTFMFWWSYLELVSILLMFTRAERDGLWDLYLYAFRCMLPWFHRYDHTNYARWGTVYLADAHQLPDDVLQEFRAGNFVVKRSNAKFNQVDPDHSQEWLNATGKKDGGIIGITRTPTALGRWALSYNLRSQLSLLTRRMYNLNRDDVLVHKESTQSRQALDLRSETSVVHALNRFSLIEKMVTESDRLVNFITNDVATNAILDSVLSAKLLGQLQLEQFVGKRLHASAEEVAPKIPLRESLKKNKPMTFDSLYIVEKIPKSQLEKNKIIKADRSTLQRLIAAYNSGRHVHLSAIMTHELMSVPIAIAETNKTLRKGNKAALFEELIKGVDVKSDVLLQGQSAIIIDGQALVQSMKIDCAQTFGDYADMFLNIVMNKGHGHERIDVVFDRYRTNSIKAGTRQCRTRTSRPVRRVIDSRDVPLPQNFSNFLALQENKSDLSKFLSEELIRQSMQTRKIIVTGGGFADEDTVKCNKEELELTQLNAKHEEADTRIVLHAIHCKSKSQCESIVVSARDTDVLLLLLYHFTELPANTWLSAGTAHNPKNVHLPTVIERHLADLNLQHNLLAFHALTGSDTTSFFNGVSKKTAFGAYKEHSNLLHGLGEGNLSEDKIIECERFVCRIYKQTADSVNEVRTSMFCKMKGPEKMPPTSDALVCHIKRAHYQTMVWKQANVTIPDLPEPFNMGWKVVEDELQPILMTADPIPQACIEIISCQCLTGCRTLRCKCKKSNLPCTDMCKCGGMNGTECINSRQ